MKFRTPVPITKSNFGIHHTDAIFCMGSCFSEHIYNRFISNKFEAILNPFGTQFHPLALENSLMRIYKYEKYTEKEIYYYQDTYFSWDHSTLFSSNSLKQTLTLINQRLEEANEFMQKASYFIFTLGTAWAYSLKKANFLVSNCHRVPQDHFDKLLLDCNQVVYALRNMIFMCKDVNPKAQIVFTISPVRHLRDGFLENNQSKAVLHLALKDILQEFSNSVIYFPSYEMVLDELRDYRFFGKDMVHPNELAVDYVWKRFSETFFDEGTKNLNSLIEKIQLAMAHRPINPNSIAHRKFLYDTLKKVEELSLRLPQNRFKKEIEELKQKIHHVH